MTPTRRWTAGLGRVHDVVARHVERGSAPGAVTLVSHQGEVHVGTIGTVAVEGTEPMRRDTIFRISSMTKPIAAAAAMILVDEGALVLDEPVDRLLPELADRTVLNRLDGPLDDTQPARRPITVLDLLTLRMGFGYAVGPAPSYPVMDAAGEHQLGMMPKPASPHGPDEWIRRFATLPLMHQPGKSWMYGMSMAVLGVLIARAGGQPLGTFLRERIFDPLGMRDTGFTVPAAELHRLPPCYAIDPSTGDLELYDTAADSQWSLPPAFPDAGGGLVSTVDDYLAFAQMLRNGGVHGPGRLLSQPSVQAMTTNQLTPAQLAGSENASMFLGDSGWGFGLEVTSSGRYGWFGGLGTSWYTEPATDLVAILMTQRLPPSIDLHNDFWVSLRSITDGC